MAPGDDRVQILRVAYADDAFLVREALEGVLARLPGVEVVARCEDGDALLRAADEHLPDVVVTDVRMPPTGDDEGIRVANRLRRRHPRMGVLVLTQYAEPRYGLDLLQAGPEGRGYLLKDRIHDPHELAAALETIARGGSVFDPAMVRLLLSSDPHTAAALAELTARERQVLAEMAQGKSNGAIADTLVLTKKAVEKHVGSIFLKLGLPDEDLVSRRVAAVLLHLAAEGERPGAGG
jgi:DNA-binding NarL/FixJ family response regulator